jgi:hypothetical protein
VKRRRWRRMREVSGNEEKEYNGNIQSLSFTVTLSTAAKLHRKPASGEASQDSNRRTTL